MEDKSKEIKNNNPSSVYKDTKDDNSVKEKASNNYVSAREQLRKNPNFVDINTLDKKTAYYHFMEIYIYLLKEKALKVFFNWNDNDIESKLEELILKSDKEANMLNTFVESKAIFGFHPETMGTYTSLLIFSDFVWQLLNRLLLIYRTFKDVVDQKTIDEFNTEKKKE